MTKLSSLTPHELVERVENRNRRFKLASIVFGAVLTAGLAVLLVIGLITLQGVNNQLAQQKRLLTSQQQILSQIQKSSNQRTQQLADLQQHIDCIVALFQKPNHQQLTITDLEDCQIDRTNTSSYNGASAPAQSAPAKTSTPSTGASNKQPTKSPSKPTKTPSRLDRVPVLGRVFRALGL